MAGFHEFEGAAPDLADRARTILSSTQNAVLGTIRRDGSLRLSGIDPYFCEGHLYVGSMPGTLKGKDLRRDPRLALHSIPWDSRRLREGAADPGDADTKFAGTAALVTDPGALMELRAGLKAEHNFEPPESFDLFVIDIESVAVMAAVDGELVVDRWSATDGRHTVRRS